MAVRKRKAVGSSARGQGASLKQRNQVVSELHSLFATTTSRQDYVEAAAELIRRWSGCRSAGIRIATSRHGMPLEGFVGYPTQFLEVEKTLSLDQGGCVCPRVIAGALEPEDKASSTANGSFYCQDLAEWISQLPAEKRNNYRGQCSVHGFASVAVIPITNGGKRLGAIHVADPKPRMVPLRTVVLLEAVAPLLGEALHRFDVEDALAGERRRLNGLLEMLPAYVALLSPDYHMPFANRFFRERFGDSQGRRCFEFLFNRNEPCETCETFKVLEMRAPHHWEWTGPDGRIYDIHDFPFTDADGSPLIMEMGIDITDRKRAEQALQKVQAALEERVQERTRQLSQSNAALQTAKTEVARQFAQLQTILDNVPEGVVVASLDGRLNQWNPAALAMHGFASQDECCRMLPELTCIFELSEPGGVLLGLEQWPLSRILRGEVLRNWEVCVRRFDQGWERIFCYGGSLVRDSDGHPLLGIVTVSDVTESKQSEQALRNSQADLKRAQSVAHTGSWRLDVHRNELLWSDEAHRIFEIQQGVPLKYETFLDTIHPEDRAYVNEKWTAALSGEKYDIEHRILVADRIKWVRERAELEFDSQGALLGGFGTVQDITEAKQAEQALRDSEERFRLLANVTAQLLAAENPQELVEPLCREVMRHVRCDCFFNFLSDDAGRQLLLNAYGGITEAEAEKIKRLDYGAAICGRAAQQGCRVVAEDVQQTEDVRTSVIKSYGVQTYACHPLCAQGRVIGTLSFGTRTRKSFSPSELELMKTVADQIAVVMQRIQVQRDLKQAHDELDRRVVERTAQLSAANEALSVKIKEHVEAVEALRKSEARLAEAQHIAHLGTWEWDVPSNQLYCSPEVFRIFGVAPQLANITVEQYLARVPNDERAHVQSAVDYALKGAGRYDLEHRIIRFDKQVYHVHVQGEVTFDRGGAPVRMLGTIMDVTARVHAEQEAVIRQQQLVQADKMVSLGILSSGIAHEINNPNHSIMSNVSLFAGVWESITPILDRFHKDFGDFVLGGYDYAEGRDKFPQMLANALASSKRIELIVKELRDYARYNPNDTMTAVDLNGVVKSAIILLGNMLKKSTEHFTTEYGENLPPVLANFQRIEQVVINLIQNACQALSGPDKGVTVTTSCPHASHTVLLEVRDEGEGMNSEDLRHIGDPFFTHKRAKGGMGLGLWISFNIVREHGGTLTFTSKPGWGTRAVLALPTFSSPNDAENSHEH